MVVLWFVTAVLTVVSLPSGRIALFTNGGNGNLEWFLIFWISSTGMMIGSGLLLARLWFMGTTKASILAFVLGGAMFLISNPIGLMAFFAIPALTVLYLLTITVLIATPIAANQLNYGNKHNQTPPRDQD